MIDEQHSHYIITESFENLIMSKTIKKYSKLDSIPTGQVSDHITEGCLVLEGGAFRGVYTGGVTDLLMKKDLNFSCTIGVSAGSMNGFNYVSGQIGRASRFNLGHRFDPNYVGLHAWKENKGIFGFDLVFDDSRVEEPFNKVAFDNPAHRFIAVATDCLTGKPAYFENGKCSDIFQAIRASSSMPIMSKPVMLDSKPYLDGGCSVAFGLDWALQEGYEKIIVVRKRDRPYRKDPNHSSIAFLQKQLYGRKYPEFLNVWQQSAERYNVLCDRTDQLEKEGRIFVIAPSVPVTVGRLEKDIEKLGSLYWMGYHDAESDLASLRAYLKKNK